MDNEIDVLNKATMQEHSSNKTHLNSSKIIRECQLCGDKELESLLFLGHVPPVNEMLAINSIPDAEVRYPLELLRCNKCTLVQIGYQVDPRILFPRSYPYLSGTTRILRDNFIDLAKEARSLLNLSSKDLIVDVGSNDGTLLKPFQSQGQRVLGIEPSQAAQVAIKQGISTLMTYFGLAIAKKVKQDYGLARVVTAANVFAHIKDVHEVIKGILCMLEPKGVFISESHYLLDLVETVQYDTVYHEHLRYYSLHSLIELFKQHDLEIFQVKRIPTHGGSIRVYAARKGVCSIHKSVAKCLAQEKEQGIVDGSGFKAFYDRVVKSKIELLKLLVQIKAQGGQIYGIGAPSRASTLISFVGLDETLIDCVLEVSGSHKLNKYMPGTRIPVVDEKKLYLEQPEYALFFSWHIAEELAENLRQRGFKGKFIVPLPQPKVLTLATEPA